MYTGQPRLILDTLKFHTTATEWISKTFNESLEDNVTIDFRYSLWDGVSNKNTYEIDILPENELERIRHEIISHHLKHNNNEPIITFNDSYIPYRFVDELLENVDVTDRIKQMIVIAISQALCRTCDVDDIDSSYDYIIQTRTDSFINFISPHDLKSMIGIIDRWKNKGRSVILFDRTDITPTGSRTDDTFVLSSLDGYKFFHQHLEESLKSKILTQLEQFRPLIEKLNGHLDQSYLAAPYFNWTCIDSPYGRTIEPTDAIKLSGTDMLKQKLVLIRPDMITDEIKDIDFENIEISSLNEFKEIWSDLFEYFRDDTPITHNKLLNKEK